MSDFPDTSAAVKHFQQIRNGGDLNKVAHDIEQAKEQCGDDSDGQARFTEYITHLNTDLRKGVNGTASIALDNFDVVDATGNSLVLKPKVSGPDSEMTLKADHIGSDSPFSYGDKNVNGAFWVTDGKLNLMDTDNPHHTALHKEGSHEIRFDPSQVYGVQMDKDGRISSVELKDGSVRDFHYDEHGKLDRWSWSTPNTPMHCWFRQTGTDGHPIDQWSLYIEKNPHGPISYQDSPPSSGDSYHVLGRATAAPDATYSGVMSMSRQGLFVQRKTGEHITSVEMLNGQHYQY
jgi:hypothetical protein